MKIFVDVNGVRIERELSDTELMEAWVEQQHLFDIDYIEGMFGVDERFDGMSADEKAEALSDIAWRYDKKISGIDDPDKFEVASAAVEDFFEEREKQKGCEDMTKLENLIGYAGAKEIIDGFQFCGDWERDQINLSNTLQRHYYDSVGVYNEGIQNAIEDKVNRVIMEKYQDKKFVVDHNGVLYEHDEQERECQKMDAGLGWGANGYVISRELYEMGKDDPILHDEDNWMGKYRTYGEMWVGEGFVIEGQNSTNVQGFGHDDIRGSGRYEIEVTIDVVGGDGKELCLKMAGNDLETLQAGILPAVQKACADQGYLDNQVVVGVLIEENGEWLDSDEETLDLGELNVEICVYADALGYNIDDSGPKDNLTNILVPKAWLFEKLKADGETDIEGWFDEYTADSTDMIARDAVAEGVVLSCLDKGISCVLGLGESFLQTNDYGKRLAAHMREVYQSEYEKGDYSFWGTYIISVDLIKTAEDAAGWCLLTYGDRALQEVQEWIDDKESNVLRFDIFDVRDILEKCVVPVKDNSLSAVLENAEERAGGVNNKEEDVGLGL